MTHYPLQLLILIGQQVDQCFKIMNARYTQVVFDQNGFEIFFGALLGMKADRILIGRVVNRGLAPGCGKVGIGLGCPFNGFRLHTAPFRG